MSTGAKQANNPFAIQLEVEFLDRLTEPVREGRAKSISELIRTALEHFNFDNLVVVRPSHLLVSVRLPREIRDKLKTVSREKHTSVGQLVRAAVESYLPQLESSTPGEIEMPIPHVELPADENLVADTPTPKSKSSTLRRKKAAEKRRPAPRKKKVPVAKRTRARRLPAASKRAGMTRKRTHA